MPLLSLGKTESRDSGPVGFGSLIPDQQKNKLGRVPLSRFSKPARFLASLALRLARFDYFQSTFSYF